ncbi:hypothetical protein [Sphingobacterium paludis]|jgi:hypothetical protein|uniref:Uncharacterized protein n=1 Tax=Sphingobacterium paludis TaxID=1476465 RepID=A0A4R7CZR4_9SPHI|nr:hypothetical protein [Sphingobacterium paludis]TDS13271.1 hypothetical protein B0I21_105407 [Sphingobacterium paludis]
MKKRHNFLVMVCVLFALTASLSAKAQYYAPVWLNYGSSSTYEFNTTGFNLTLYNNETSEYYYFETYGRPMIDGTTYDMGDVPAGNYKISISMRSFMRSEAYFDWTGNGQSGTNVYIGIFGETVLTEDIVINETTPGIELYLTSY